MNIETYGEGFRSIWFIWGDYGLRLSYLRCSYAGNILLVKYSNKTNIFGAREIDKTLISF